MSQAPTTYYCQSCGIEGQYPLPKSCSNCGAAGAWRDYLPEQFKSETTIKVEAAVKAAAEVAIADATDRHKKAVQAAKDAALAALTAPAPAPTTQAAPTSGSAPAVTQPQGAGQ